MKTLRYIGMALVAITLTFGLASCNDDDDDNDAAETDSNAANPNDYPVVDDFHSECTTIKTFGTDSKSFIEAYLQETTPKGVDVYWKAIYYLDDDAFDQNSPVYFSMESSGENVYLKSFRIRATNSYMHVGEEVDSDFTRTYRYLKINNTKELFHVGDEAGTTDGNGIPYNEEISVNDSVSSIGLCFMKYDPVGSGGDDGLIRLVDKANDGEHSRTFTFIDSNIIHK